MPNVNDVFTSKYLRAADFEAGPELLKMGRTELATLKEGEGQKIILYFEGKEKGVALNKTNATTIAKLYGNDTEEWRGRMIVVFQAYVDMKGETVPAIRMRAPKKTAAPAKELNDEVPF
jgi:hypothetical protein